MCQNALYDTLHVWREMWTQEAGFRKYDFSIISSYESTFQFFAQQLTIKRPTQAQGSALLQQLSIDTVITPFLHCETHK